MLRNGFADVLTQILPVQLPIPLRRLAAGAIGLTRLEDVYRRLMLLEDCGPISTRLLSFLDVRTRVSDTDLARIPRTGPAIVVANHPQGILDGAILHDMLTNVRSDV